jgi:hypothetical protein
MTLWLGLVLGAMTLVGTWFPASSADYAGLLGCFQPPDPSGTEPTCADGRKSQAQPRLTDDRFPSYFES